MQSLADKGLCAVVPVGEASPVAYLNVYEPGDVWMKTRDCDGCSDRRADKDYRNCCGNCPLVMANGQCYLHVVDPGTKPLRCVVNLPPNQANSFCSLEFKCVEGPRKGQVRRAQDRGNVFMDGG